MAVMDLDNRVRMCEIFADIFFPNRLESWGHAMWGTHWGVTFVTMWNKEHLMRNQLRHDEGAHGSGTSPVLHIVKYDASF